MNPIQKWKERRAVAKWEAEGRPAPPPHSIKQRNLLDYQERFGLKILVETGTFKGDMVAAMKDAFDKVYSVELAETFYRGAVERFRSDSNVRILQGDSGKVFGDLVPELSEPTLFWLDGHYSAGETARGDKDTPVMEELGHIFARDGLKCVILIDDARCFEGESEQVYPSMDELTAFVASHRPDWEVEVDTDCIRITPPQ